MMRHSGALLAICFGLLLTAVAHAAPVFVMGKGHDSCGELIGAIGDAPPGKYGSIEHGVYLEWLSGFVSGFNATHAGQQVRGIDPAGMDLWMRNWCNQHPTEKVVDGAPAFISEMLTNAARKQ
jgi:hypothetical protein